MQNLLALLTLHYVYIEQKWVQVVTWTNCADIRRRLGTKTTWLDLDTRSRLSRLNCGDSQVCSRSKPQEQKTVFMYTVRLLERHSCHYDMATETDTAVWLASISSSRALPPSPWRHRQRRQQITWLIWVDKRSRCLATTDWQDTLLRASVVSILPSLPLPPPLRPPPSSLHSLTDAVTRGRHRPSSDAYPTN